jgi:tripartite ATP-independent transporter DctP family solute receptor
MSKKWLLILIALTVISSITFRLLNDNQQTVKDNTDNGKEIILRLGHGADTANPRHQAAMKYAAWITEQTNGRVKIELFPTEILGSDKQMFELVKDGTLDMTLAFSGIVANLSPKLNVIELPFMFSSIDKVTAVLDGPIGEELAKDLPEKGGSRVLAYWDNGLRSITNNKQPIEKPEDLKDLKFRTPESKMTMSIFKSLGATPAPLAWNEVYLALAQGTFDGQENPIANIYGAKLSEVQRYMTITNHKYDATPLIINEKKWQGLPPDIQKILKEGAVKFAIENRKINQETEGKLLADLEAKGMKISRPDITSFREATKPVYDEWAPVIGKELIDKVLAATK